MQPRAARGIFLPPANPHRPIEVTRNSIFLDCPGLGHPPLPEDLLGGTADPTRRHQRCSGRSVAG
jgi:hypothetical protein